MVERDIGLIAVEQRPSARAGSATGKVRRRLPAWLGIGSGGLGALGAIHSACHSACLAIVAALALVGVSIAGMPLGFLLNPWLVVLFSALGLGGVSASVILRLRRCGWRRPAPAGAARWRRGDLALLGVSAALSSVSLALGVRELTQPAAAGVTAGLRSAGFRVEHRTQSSSGGGAYVGVTYLGRTGRAFLFRVEMNAASMNAPAFSRYDLARLSRLDTNARPMAPRSWRVLEGGHMGHHLRGLLVFPLRVQGRASISGRLRSFTLVIDDVAGVPRRRLVWKIARA